MLNEESPRKRPYVLYWMRVAVRDHENPALDAAVGLPFAARLAVVVVALTPVGALMGAVLPLAVKLVALRSPELLPWCWGLAGAAGVVGVGAGTFVAIGLGYSALLLAAGLGYLLAAATVPEVKGPAAF